MQFCHEIILDIPLHRTVSLSGKMLDDKSLLKLEQSTRLALGITPRSANPVPDQSRPSRTGSRTEIEVNL
ncbi:MAG: hypothetical protein V4719_13800 [Planctomycetota bacterium]